jgi:hypothetical protein
LGENTKKEIAISIAIRKRNVILFPIRRYPLLLNGISPKPKEFLFVFEEEEKESSPCKLLFLFH